MICTSRSPVLISLFQKNPVGLFFGGSADIPLDIAGDDSMALSKFPNWALSSIDAGSAGALSFDLFDSRR